MDGILTGLRKLQIANWVLTKWHPIIPYKLKQLPFKIYIDPLRDTRELFTRSYEIEKEVQQCIIDLIKQNSFCNFLDIGANIGFYTWLVHSISPDTICHIFEPDRYNIKLLSKTANRLNSKNLVVNELAVSDHNGKIDFFADNITQKTGSTTLVYSGKNYAENFFSQKRESSSVDCITLDVYTQSLSGAFLVKCDVEGAENLVVSGSLEFIKNHKPHMIIEINRNNKETLPSYIESLGYKSRILSKPGMLDQDYYFYPIG